MNNINDLFYKILYEYIDIYQFCEEGFDESFKFALENTRYKKTDGDLINHEINTKISNEKFNEIKLIIENDFDSKRLEKSDYLNHFLGAVIDCINFDFLENEIFDYIGDLVFEKIKSNKELEYLSV